MRPLLVDAEPHLAGFHQLEQRARLMASGGASEVRLSVDSILPDERVFVALACFLPSGGPSARVHPLRCSAPGSSPSTARRGRSAGAGGSWPCLSVTTFQPLLRLLRRSGAQVRAEIGLGTRHFGRPHEFVRSEAVVLHRAPCHLQAPGTLIAWANAVRPVVTWMRSSRQASAAA